MIYRIFLAIALCIPGFAVALYEDAMEFAPRIRDRLNCVGSGVVRPSPNGRVLQLTDDTFWVLAQVDDHISEWLIGDVVLLIGLPSDGDTTAELHNLTLDSRCKVYRLGKRYKVEAEPVGSMRGLTLPRIDKACLFKIDAQRNVLRIGAQRQLWEFDSALYGMLETIDWARGIRVEIRGSDHPDFPYWVMYKSPRVPWVNILIVKPFPRIIEQ